MLMTPMTPKVMARPIAASSSTEPSEMPYQTFWPADQMASELSMPAIAAAGGVLQRAFGGCLERGEQRQRLAVAARREHLDRRELVGFGRSETRTAEARACSSRALTAASVSLAIAASSAANAAGSGLRNMFSAAASRTAGSGEPSVSVPSTSRMTRRSPLLTLILVSSALAASPAASPVSGSSRLTPSPPP